MKYMDATPLNVEEEQRRSDLVQRLKQGTISLTEAQQLRDLLEREKHVIAQQRNCLAYLAVTFLISYVDDKFPKENKSIPRVYCFLFIGSSITTVTKKFLLSTCI